MAIQKDGNNTAANVSTRCSGLHQGNEAKHKAIMIFIYSVISPWDELLSLLGMGCHLSSGQAVISVRDARLPSPPRCMQVSRKGRMPSFSNSTVNLMEAVMLLRWSSSPSTVPNSTMQQMSSTYLFQSVGLCGADCSASCSKCSIHTFATTAEIGDSVAAPLDSS